MAITACAAARLCSRQLKKDAVGLKLLVALLGSRMVEEASCCMLIIGAARAFDALASLPGDLLCMLIMKWRVLKFHDQACGA
jgi:hypothetical protein